MEEIDCIVAGAGVVGLAIARILALRGLDVLILEKADAIGTQTSSRNSEVIHAGIYYPPGSLKAGLCIAGRDMLYAYCTERGIAHRRCGKMIVATSENQKEALAGIAENARASGAGELKLLTAEKARALEPALFCTAALLSPDTGIIDSHELMLSLLGDAEAAGAMLSFNTEIISGRVRPDHIVLTTRNTENGDTFEIATRHLINAAGLGAVALAGAMEGLDPYFVPKLHYAKGNYFSVTGQTPFQHLIYPVPEPGGLGTHLTLDLNGVARFGPDVEWIDGIDYRVDPARANCFYEAIRAYWPDLADASLQPAYSGIRPKLSGAGEANMDFVIQGPATHGISGLVNLFGIESPGLTACLAIARHVGHMLADEEHVRTVS